ncbi:hypothetical protein [Nitrosomonas nitrosa]|uniref:hypothetical protein n=1 Tax=Nitrosomonas nitrosa TaxID=52442 RepID=UPI0023F64F04|nr:hypothetical protein [Nitrosomonas nitrosa]MCO6433480.1 hypothetical protein [Nitrosomonas nitrosa]
MGQQLFLPPLAATPWVRSEETLPMVLNGIGKHPVAASTSIKKHIASQATLTEITRPTRPALFSIRQVSVFFIHNL